MKAVTILILAAAFCRSQGTFVTVAGTGATGFNGDGGLAIAATLSGPSGVAVDNTGNFYIADVGNYRVRRVNSAGIISTFAGNGKPGGLGSGQPGNVGDGGAATSAELYSILGPGTSLQGITFDPSGNLYIADFQNHYVRKVNTSGIITTFAGNGTTAPQTDNVKATQSAVANPTSVAADAAGNIYIADSLSSKVRKVDTAGIITTCAGITKGPGVPQYSGDGGPATLAALGTPLGIAVDRAGNLYINDRTNGRIRKVDTSGIITTYAGNGTTNAAPPSGDGGQATNAVLFDPQGMAVDQAGNLYIADIVPLAAGGTTPGLRKVDTSGIISSIAAGANIVSVTDVAIDFLGNIFIAETGRIAKLAAALPPAPVVTAVLNGASFLPGVTANSWVTIQGKNLALATGDWTNSVINGNLPVILNGVTVSIGGLPAYIYYTSLGQLNVLAPNVPPGPVSVTVTTAGGTSPPFAATAGLYGPAFFEWPGSQPVATRPDYSLAVKPGTFSTTTLAAKPGDVIVLWGTGLGPTNPPTPVGVAVPGGQTYATMTAPVVSLNNSGVIVYGAALASGAAGLFQIAIQVPTGLADGDYPIQASIGGAQSPSGVLLSVHH